MLLAINSKDSGTSSPVPVLSHTAFAGVTSLVPPGRRSARDTFASASKQENVLEV